MGWEFSHWRGTPVIAQKKTHRPRSLGVSRSPRPTLARRQVSFFQKPDMENKYTQVTHFLKHLHSHCYPDFGKKNTCGQMNLETVHFLTGVLRPQENAHPPRTPLGPYA